MSVSASLVRKLDRWEGAGVIDAPTRARIEAHEHRDARPVVFYALGGLGALTVGIGIISVVAANWADISGTTKLAVDLLLAVLLAAWTYRFHVRRMRWPRELLVTIFYAFTLASIALIGQVYQLGSPTWVGLLMWSVVTFPLALLGQTTLFGMVWLAGLVTTGVVTVEPLADWLTRAASGDLALNVMLAWGFAAPFVAVAMAAGMRKYRPAVAVVFQSAGLLAIAGIAVLGQLAWWADIDEPKLGLAALLTAGVVAWAYRFVGELVGGASAEVQRRLRITLVAMWLTLAVALLLPREPVSLFGAVLQIGMLGTLAWTVVAAGKLRLFDALTGMIAVRVLVLYFEAFGGMLDTGLAMIGGGLLTILLGLIWRRKSPVLAAAMAGEDGLNLATKDPGSDR